MEDLLNYLRCNLDKRYGLTAYYINSRYYRKLYKKNKNFSEMK